MQAQYSRKCPGENTQGVELLSTGSKGKGGCHSEYAQTQCHFLKSSELEPKFAFQNSLTNSLSFLLAFFPSIYSALICITIQTLSFILTNLPAVVASVPLPIRYLFLVAEKQLSQHSRQLHLVGLSLWALLGCLIQGLEDLDTLEQISGLTLDQGAKEPLSLLAECLQAAMGIQQKVESKGNVITTQY